MPTCCCEHYYNNFDMKWNSIVIDMQHENFGSLGTVQFQQCAATRLPMREHDPNLPPSLSFYTRVVAQGQL
jgi:hypothetical protein